MNDEAVYKTAPATPVLLNIFLEDGFLNCINLSAPSTTVMFVSA